MPETLELEADDRWTAMKILRVLGKRWYEMVPVLIELGFLECQTSHRRRRVPSWIINGEVQDVCATCENTITQEWRRNLARLSQDEAQITEARWHWFRVHELLERLCIERAVQNVKITTTRTEIVDGQEVVTTTVREETRVNTGLLRLASDVRDKMARMSGLDLANPIPDRPPERRKLNVYRRTADDDRGDRPN